MNFDDAEHDANLAGHLQQYFPINRFWIFGILLSVLFHIWVVLLSANVLLEDPNSGLTLIETRFEVQKQPEKKPEPVVPYELVDPNDRDYDVRKVLNAMSQGQRFNVEAEMKTAPVKSVDLSAPQPMRKFYDVPEGAVLDDRLAVSGLSHHGVVQIESALDRVTWEIAQTLQERRVLVVWLLDASASLTEQREKITGRLNRIYGELDALKRDGQIPRVDQPLLSGVVTYGQQTQFLTREPTSHFAELQQAIEGVQNDTSGRENVFTAVHQVMKLWSKYRTQQGRQIMLIAVTDESGDDFEMHEQAIVSCRRYGARAYVIGPTAVFGRRKGYVPYVAPEDGKTYQLPVDLGPETVMYDLVELQFWFQGPQFRYLSSGFGPYALSRLVRETGGIYFTTNMTTMKGFTPEGIFDPELLKPFEPDYQFGTPQKYMQHLSKHPLRRSVVLAAQLSRDNPAEGTPQLELRVTDRNFRQVAADAQRTVARSQLMIDNILQAFPAGIEKQLQNEDSPRWRMAFCLSYGRLLAQRVRCYEYNYACAYLKNNLAEQDINTKSNHWIFKPRKEIKYATTMKRSAALALSLLQRVVDDAPGTPWALLATRELHHPLGIEIDQRFIPPPPPPKQTVNNAPPKPPKPRLLLAPENKPKPNVPKPKPPKPVLPRL